MIPNAHYARLDRAVITLDGPDVRPLLQGIITADIGRLAPGKPLYACLLTPQGKYLFDFFLTDRGGPVWLDVAAIRAAELVKKLTLYRLRSQVTIAPAPELAVYAAWGGAMPAFPEAVAATADPRAAALGERVTGTADAVEAAFRAAGFIEVDESAYHLRRIEAVIAEGESELTAEKSFPLEYGLDGFGAIDFDKGCYVGQEVTARTRHRGVIRKHLFRVQAEAGAPLTDGAPVTASGREIGEIRSVVGPHGLALLRIEELEAARSAGAAIEAAGVSLTVL